MTVVLVVLAVAAAAACQAPIVPIGTRAAGDNVEAFVGSCSGVAIDVELLETDVPMPTTTRGRGTTPGTDATGEPIPTTRGTVWSPGEPVWEGTVPAGQQSIVIPVVLDPSSTYTITAHGDGDPHFEDFTFVSSDLAADGVTPYGTWNPPVTPEAFAERFDAACDDAAGDPVRWIILSLFLAAILVAVGLVVGLALLIRSATKPRRPPTPPAPTWGT